jgi:hypothetical protein
VTVVVLLALCALVTVVVWIAGERTAAPPASPPATSALEDEVKRLRRENTELREQLARRPRARAETRAPEPDRGAGGPAAELETPRVADGVPARAVEKGILGAVAPTSSVADLIEMLRKQSQAAGATTRAIEAALLSHGADAVEPLMALVRDASATAESRDAALRVLARLEVPGLAALVENLYVNARGDSAMTPARRGAALSAAVAADPQAASAVVQRLLWSEAAGDRETALTGLAAARDPALLPVLREQVMRPEAAQHGASLADAIAVIRGRRWSALQATGAPDTPVAGDIGAAWASKEADMGDVWLELDFEIAVAPQSIRIRETYNPGAVARVEAVLEGGTRETLWEGRADAAQAPRWFEPALRSASASVRTIRLVLDTNRVQGWNEIDAVELLGDGRRQWASEARASSSYSDP